MSSTPVTVCALCVALQLFDLGCGGKSPGKLGPDSSVVDSAYADSGAGADTGAGSDAGTAADTGTGDGAAGDAGNVLGANECRGEGDCAVGMLCLAPGEFAGCGICRVPEAVCTSDTECTNSGEVCESARTDCFCGGEQTCRSGCTSTSCNEGERCAVSGHCEPASCGPSATCPTEFDCVSGSCERRTCGSDGDCADGWCVESKCYVMPGDCSFIPA